MCIAILRCRNKVCGEIGGISYRLETNSEFRIQNSEFVSHLNLFSNYESYRR